MSPGPDASRFDAALVQAVLACDFRAVSRMLSLVENDPKQAMRYIRELFGHTGRCFTLGITGAPGAGKSTLLDRLASRYRKQGRKVGILAVDPTSPFTGGAILGDRIRMHSQSVDSGTFIRSMATRGAMGGLSRATADALLVLDSAGFEIVMIETVGVGQDEVEIVRTAQATIVVLVPGMGDEVQAMKAGVMEIADIFVINKADHAGADRIEAELKGVLQLSKRADGWIPEVVRTIAPQGKGVEACAEAIENYRRHLERSSFRMQRSVEHQRDRILALAREHVTDAILRDSDAAGRLDELAKKVAGREIDPYTAMETLLSQQPGRDRAGKEP